MKHLAILLLALSLAPAAPAAPDEKPRVLLLGDSISIGYTPHVQALLKDQAVVVRPTLPGKPSRPENCAGTTKGLQALSRWLQIDGGNWDVIHFNFGLHDLKREHPDTGRPSANPDHPRQATLEVYERQLREIVRALKKSGAKLIFATTTPVPPGGVRPHRDVADVPRYNAAAKRIMQEEGVAVNDLYAFALPRLKEIQQPVNVHFSPSGSKALAQEVARHVRKALP